MMSGELLYPGTDLRNAANLSCVGTGIADKVSGVRNAAAISLDMLRERRGKDAPFRICIARGSDATGSSEITAVYAGTGSNLAWCLGTALSHYEIVESLVEPTAGKLLRRLKNYRDAGDIIFVDGLKSRLLAELEIPFAQLPAWVKQRVQVSADWRSQIDNLRRGTRQEIARVLRKHHYTCRLTDSPDDARQFYSSLYKPYVANRFGSDGIVVNESRFLRECRRGIVIQLSRGPDIAAAALLRRVGSSMAIVWSGVESEPAGERLSGAVDVLDYFSLLYAHLKGCRWLDFGPSRPDLNDGILRYKRKWGCHIGSGWVPQSTIYWACLKQNSAVDVFLKRHAFLLTGKRGLCALLFLDSRADIEVLRTDILRNITPGIVSYLVVMVPIPGRNLVSELEGLNPAISVLGAESLSGAFNVAMQGQHSIY